MRPKLRSIFKIILALTACGALVLACIWLFPLVLSLREPETQEQFRGFISSLGVLGFVLMLLLQTAQIVVAVIPGEPIEILLGMMYGTFGGLLTSLLGIAIGQTLVFLLVKRFGISFASRFVDVKKFGKLKFLQSKSKRDSLIFLLFFIPGTPKDILTYFAPFTGIGYLNFILLTTFARIPSVVSSTWAGASLSEGAFLKTLLIFAITGVIGLVGIIVNDRIHKAGNNNNSKETNK